MRVALLAVIAVAVVCASVAAGASVSIFTVRSGDIVNVPQVGMQCGLSKVQGKQAFLCWPTPQKQRQLTVGMLRDRVLVVNGGRAVYSGAQRR